MQISTWLLRGLVSVVSGPRGTPPPKRQHKAASPLNDIYDEEEGENIVDEEAEL